MFDKSALLSRFDKLYEEACRSQPETAPKFSDIGSRPTRQIHPFLYLPVEVKAREFYSKAILAKQAAEAGMRVVLGAIWSLHPWAPFLPPGIVLFKSMNALDANNMAWWVQHGHMTAVLDEEIFGVTPSRAYLEATIHPHVPALADFICAQGQAYADAFPFPCQIDVTGTPRTLTYKAPKGSDILVCLQFGNINNNGRSFDEMVTTTLRLSASLATAEGAEWAKILRDAIAQECDILPLVRQTIVALSNAFPSRRIVVRPHPVENPATWSFEAPNIFIDRHQSVIEAIEEAAVLIYVSGCTTGIDAWLAGLPAVKLGTGGHGLSARLNAPVMTPEDAVRAVKHAGRWPEKLDQYFAPLTMIENFVKLYRNNPATGTPRISQRVKAEPKEFHTRKFPNTTADEMAGLVGRPVKEIGWNTFLI